MSYLGKTILGLGFLACGLGGYMCDKSRQKQVETGGEQVLRTVLEKDIVHDPKTYVSSLEDFLDEKGLDKESPQYAYEKQIIDRISLRKEDFIMRHESFKDLIKETTEDKVLYESEIKDLWYHVSGVRRSHRDLALLHAEIGKDLPSKKLVDDYTSLQKIIQGAHRGSPSGFDVAFKQKRFETQLKDADLPSKIPGSEDFKPWKYVYLLPVSVFLGLVALGLGFGGGD